MSNVRVPDCSYIALAEKNGKVNYGQVASSTPVSWKGTSAQGTLAFPASGQSWPGLSVSLVTVTLTPSAISGQLSPEGRISVDLPLNVMVSAGGFGQCRVRGVVTLATDGVDQVGGGTGLPRDPASGRFALAGTTTTPPTFEGTSNLCAQAQEFVDFTRGLGFYLTGTMTISQPATGGVVGAQTAVFDGPTKIKRKGRTVLLSKPVITNAGQQAAVTVRWSRSKAASGTSPRLARVTTSPKGKVTLVTTGKAKTLHVRMTLSAPPAPGFDEYLQMRRWTVR